MRGILEELWYGNVSPNDDRKMSHEARSQTKKLADAHANLSSELSQEQKNLLKEFEDAYSELNCTNEREIFVYAFRLGAKIALEIAGYKQ